MRFRRATLVAAMVLLGTSGCKDEPPEPPPQVCEPSIRQTCACEIGSGTQDCNLVGSGWSQCLCPIKTAKFNPGAKSVTISPSSGMIVESESSLRVPTEGNAELASLKEGDVLVHFGDPPLLRKILAVREEGGVTVFDTRLAALSEAFEELDIEMEEVPLNMYGSLPQQARDQLEAERIGLGGGAGGLSFGAAGDLAPSISISDESTVRFEPRVSAKIKVGCCPSLKEFRFVATMNAGFDLTATVGLEGEGTATAEIEMIEAVLSNLKPPIEPPELKLPLAAGLAASPKLIIGCELEVEGSVEITTRVYANFDLAGGVTFDSSRDGQQWRVVNQRNVSGGAELLDNQWKAGVTFTCYVRPRIEMTFLEVVTGYAQVGPEAISKLEVGPVNTFDVDVGVRGTVGYEIGVEVFDAKVVLAEDSYDVFNLSTNLYHYEFAICGDGYRQQGTDDAVAEECDRGLLAADGICGSDCKCLPGFNPYEFDEDFADDEVDGTRSYTQALTLNQCRPACGDGVVSASDNEACDLGRVGNGTCWPEPGCAADCSRPIGVCGDGIVDSNCGEVCDDGNTNDCDGCSSNCWQTDFCGDGLISYACGEQCDDTNTVDGDGCTSTCQLPRCGDGVVNGPGETCDDGNTDNCDGCHNNCQVNENRCGDYQICGMETCDAGPGGDWNCDADCTLRECGDGFVHPGEECDPPSTTCTMDCRISRCGDNTVNALAGEECDSGGQDTWSCDSDCTLAACGDGYVNSARETCDDGDTDACTPACDAQCMGPARAAVCGDDVVECGEGCDDGPRNGVCGFCAGDCSTPVGVCGDGVVDGSCGEVCDDGNTVDGDGCRGDCRGLEVCGDGLQDSGEACDDGNAAACQGSCNETCTGTYAGSCGDGTVTPPCEVCEDTTSNGVDQGCSTSDPHCSGCGRCSADICGDGVIGPSEMCELFKTCSTSETPCVTNTDCGIGQTCDAYFGDMLCNETCTRVQVCGDGFIDGTEECDDGNTTDLDGCASYCVIEVP